MLDKARLRIAMQKSGRLSDDSRALLARCGIKINLNQQHRLCGKYAYRYFVSEMMISQFVMDGVVDLGIIGENVLEEELLNAEHKEKIQVISHYVVLTLVLAVYLAAPVDF